MPRPRTKANPEDILAFQMKVAGLSFKQQVRFHPIRQWRADFVVEERLILEVEGGLYVNGGHNRGAMIEDTMEKLAEAAMLGYTTLRVSSEHVRRGWALKWIEKLLAQLGRGPYANSGSGKPPTHHDIDALRRNGGA